MAVTRKQSLVTFKLRGVPDDPNSPHKNEVFLRVEGDWVIRAGTKPDINIATVAFSEFDKLWRNTNPAKLPPPEAALNLRGEIRLYSGEVAADGSTPPDVIIGDRENDNSIDIILIEPSAQGLMRVKDSDKPDDPPVAIKRITEYTLYFADWRHRIQPPRCGRLFHGKVNSGEPDADQNPLLPNSSLAARCLRAIGNAMFPEPPASMDDVAPRKGLNWLGAHPTEELGKLLEHTGHVLCPARDRNARITKIGDGDEPTIPAGSEYPVFEHRGIDRRGRIVVVTSAPTPIVDTWTVAAASPPELEFVASGADRKMVALGDVAEIGMNLPQLLIREGLASITDPERRQWLWREMFRFVRLHPPERYPPAAAKILRKQLLYVPKTSTEPSKIIERDPCLVAKVALWSADGTWNDSDDPVKIPVVWLGDGNIMYVNDRIGRVEGGGPAGDFDRNFVEIADTSEIKLEISVEAFDEDAEMKHYFAVGFEQRMEDGAPTIVQLSDAAAQGYLVDGGSDDVIVISMPELQYVRTNGQTDPVQIQELTARARARAEMVLAGSERPVKVRAAAGFHPGEPNGKIAEIRYSQAKCTTVFKIDTWWMPDTDAIGEIVSREKPGATEQRIASTGPERAYLGAAGDDQPAVPIAPAPATPSASTAVIIVEISSNAPDGEYYAKTVALDGTVPADPDLIAKNLLDTATHELTDTSAGPIVLRRFLGLVRGTKSGKTYVHIMGLQPGCPEGV